MWVWQCLNRGQMFCGNGTRDEAHEKPRRSGKRSVGDHHRSLLVLRPYSVNETGFQYGEIPESWLIMLHRCWIRSLRYTPGFVAL
jgi:hypothetical protein